VQVRHILTSYFYVCSTVDKTSTGRPVDAVICPLAPFPAARRERFAYYGYSTWVNALDYTSVVVPVTTVDKKVDLKEQGFKALDEQDKSIQDDCKCARRSGGSCLKGEWCANTSADDPEIYDGAHVSVQLVGRRLQEEKMIAVAELVGNIIGK